MDTPETSGAGNTTRGPGQRARRPRAARACDLCRLKKNKCDEKYPCTFCKNRDVECVYKGQDMSRKRFTPEYVKGLEDQLRRLSAIVESRDKPQPADGHGRSPLPTAKLTRVGSVPSTNGHDHQADGNDIMPTPSSVSTRHASEQEVSGVNCYTKNVEFYGSSSSVALLSQAQQTSEEANLDSAALVSSLHNPAFRAKDPEGGHNSRNEGQQLARTNHYSQCRGFLDSFFSSIHYIHPILEKARFLHRCEELWSGTDMTAGRSSFTALYYSVLSLGALVSIREEEQIGGLDNIQWSRRFFDESKRCCNELGMVTDLEMVQCYFIMAKICQNELHPHWCYMYVGLSVRTALAMGINREPGVNTNASLAQIRAESRTWWGLYSLETEMSFSMGRPDTLGADAYHNRRFPLIHDSTTFEPNSPDLFDPPHCAIIKVMVDFSRIARNICLGIYLPDTPVPRTVTLAYQIEKDLDLWLDKLPEEIRPELPPTAQPSSLRSAKEARWVKRQKLVLTIRYYNLRILLFGSFLLRSSADERASMPLAQDGIRKCLDSAKHTINVIYQTYQHTDFFKTWYYNTTYTVFAASIILVYVTQEAAGADTQSLLQLVDMAVEILEIMDECVVALASAKVLRRAKDRTEKNSAATTMTPDASDRTLQLNHFWGPLNILEGDMETDFAFQLASFDEGNAFFMAMNDQP